MKYLKGYTEYVYELTRYMSRSSNSGRTKEFDDIYDDPDDAKPYSAAIMLKNKLMSDEFMDKFEKDPTSISREDLMNLPKRQRRLIIAKSNINFLKNQPEDDLYCSYCGKGPLKVYDIKDKFNKLDGATVDHKTPTSRGGDIFDYDNLAVCCYRCNQNKSDMEYDTWMDKINNNND